MSAEQDLANANVQIANLISEVTRFRDAAMGINNIWPTITEGRNNTADGKYFSVPGNGAYLKLYRRAGTSQTLIAEFPDRAQVQGIVDLLAGRGVVGGPGDLMAEGAYGIGGGAPAEMLDINDHTIASGFYAFGPSTQGDTPVTAGTCIVTRRSSRTLQLVVFERQINPEVLSRAYNSGWGPWSKQFGTTNLLGTVSQSGGVPTGAVFERGSNSFWEWTKYADGTMEAFARIVHNNEDVSIPAGSAYRSNSFIPPDLPAGFIATPKIATDYRAVNTTETWGASAGPGSSIRPFDSYRFVRPSSATGLTLIASINAKGRWY